MSAIDITRHMRQPAKRYSGVIQLQGSILLDSELNERDTLQEDAHRRLLTDFICGRASPDDGFKIDAITANPYDFTIRAGTLYLGGLRLDAERDERFRLQSDWLQQPDPAVAPPTLADIAGGPRFDLVWIAAWQQPVSGTEDGEIVEKALGGPQTSARMRPIRRVALKTIVADNCPDAFAALLAEQGGTFHPETCELVPAQRMQVGFTGAAGTPDPCSPGAKTGFLGAENETIQVRVLSNNRFVWGYGNGAPVYKVKLWPKNAPAQDEIEFLTLPRDQTLRPRSGDMVELIRCDAFLANGQLAGEHHGRFFVVGAAFNPDTRRIALATHVGANFSSPARAQQLAASLAAELPAGFALEPEFYYLRVWRGQTIAQNETGIAYQPNVAVPLGATGVSVTFSSAGKAGDFWTFSVRPHTPDIILPWEMRKPGGVPPTGPRRHVAPLALVEWYVGQDGNGANVVKWRIHDCRNKVRKLCRATGCCEITVGDGRISHGDVDSIEAALALLPPDGGRICLLRGHHDGHVALERLVNVTIEGCGALSVVHGTPGRSDPVFDIVDCTGIRLGHFAIDAPQTIAVALRDTAAKGVDFGRALSDIALEELAITARDAAAILFDGGSDLAIESCRIDLAALEGAIGERGTLYGTASAILLFGARMRVERCAIAGVADAKPNQRPFGGIHVFGGSEDIEIRRNLITLGSGTGVQLGSISFVKAEGKLGFTKRLLRAKGEDEAGRHTMLGRGFVVSEDGCIKFPPGPGGHGGGGGGGGDGDGRVPDADPPIIRLRILDNDIVRMGGDGIGVFAFFDINDDAQLISLSDVEIRDNRISRCATREAPELEGGLYAYSARGGIVLAHAELLVVADNVITDNGAKSDDPICGVFCLYLEQGAFTGNRISDNGSRILRPDQAIRLGQRGGIVILYALPSRISLSDILGEKHADRIVLQGGGEAVTVLGNRISQPEGRAVQVSGVGAMLIEGNQLASLGASSLSWIRSILGGTAAFFTPALPPGSAEIYASNPLEFLFTGAVISVVNLCVAGELGPAGFGLALTPTAGDGEVAARPSLLANGKVLFNSNQTHFDATARAVSAVFSGVFLFSLDDIQMGGNQCDADLTEDFMLTHVFAMATSLHVQSNRISEPYVREEDGFPRVRLSALTIATANFTVLNFSTHCILAKALQPPVSVIDANRAWLEIDKPGVCRENKGFAVAGSKATIATGYRMARQ